jgi:hypothetical protein
VVVPDGVGVRKAKLEVAKQSEAEEEGALVFSSCLFSLALSSPLLCRLLNAML